MQQRERESGRVNGLVQEKGFGFIAAEAGDNVFFLRRDIKGVCNGIRPPFYMPPQGAQVTFLRVPITALDDKGRKKRDQAIDIEVV